MSNARDSYQPENCSSVYGIHLFKHLNLDLNDPSSAQPLQFYFGNGDWAPCPKGIPDVLANIRWTNQITRRGCLQSAEDLPEDWGLIANISNEITHRAFLNGQVVAVQYLGHINGELSTNPAKLNTLGIHKNVLPAFLRQTQPPVPEPDGTNVSAPSAPHRPKP